MLDASVQFFKRYGVREWGIENHPIPVNKRNLGAPIS